MESTRSKKWAGTKCLCRRYALRNAALQMSQNVALLVQEPRGRRVSRADRGRMYPAPSDTPAIPSDQRNSRLRAGARSTWREAARAPALHTRRDEKRRSTGVLRRKASSGLRISVVGSNMRAAAATSSHLPLGQSHGGLESKSHGGGNARSGPKIGLQGLARLQKGKRH